VSFIQTLAEKFNSQRFGVNDHLRSRWLEFSRRSGERQEDLSTLIVELAIPPRRDAEHPVCMARIEEARKILGRFER
jgi:hypothetical protein